MLPPLPAEDDPGYAQALAVQLASEDAAVNVLWALSGRQFGICPKTVRPCADEHQPLRGAWGPLGTAAFSWLIMDDFSGDLLDDWACHGKCLISSPQAVHLPGPVYQDTSGDYPIVVTLHDYVLDTDDYVVEGDVLHRRWEMWPRQNFAKPLGEAGTWSVNYWRGVPPPAITARFVGCLTKEFIASCSGGDCRLPRSITHLSRTGVSYEIDALKIIAAGKTGLSEVDLWLATINPSALRQGPLVI